jgi:two-component system, chemotaxis family, chemotaxis protein CheY
MSTTGKRTVLIVEDDQLVLDMLQQVMTVEGFSFETSKNGKEAIVLLEQTPTMPRVMLLDLVMPVLDGWGVVRWLVEHPNVKANVKVVLMSANERLKQASDLEHDAELPKPIDIDKLLTTINSLM